MFKLNNLKQNLLIVFFGAILTLSFAPYRIDIIAIISMSVFFYFIDNASTKFRKFAISFLFGFAFYSSSVYWIYIPVSLFTGYLSAGILLALLLITVATFVTTVPFTLLIHFLTRKNDNNIAKIIIYPALWVLFEIFKAKVIFGGFPWVSLGYSQTESPLIQYANVGSVYFVSYIIALIAIILALYISSKNKKKIAYSLITIFIIYSLGYLISLHNFYKIEGKAQKVTLVQGDFVSGFKWNYNNFQKMQTYYKNIASKTKNSMIFYSENSLPTYKSFMPFYLKNLKEIALKNNDSIMVGSLDSNKNRSKYYNASYIVGNGSGTYLKHHLVPFGEYFPIISSLEYSKKAGLTGFSKGKEIQPLMNMFNNKVANFICYEIAYPEQVRLQLQNASFISVISDDSWFGNSNASYQQLQMAQVRAIENSKYVVATSSSGITAIINPKGKIIKSLPKNKQATLTGYVYKTKSNTIWQIIGMYLIYGIIIISLLTVIIIFFKIDIKN